MNLYEIGFERFESFSIRTPGLVPRCIVHCTRKSTVDVQNKDDQGRKSWLRLCYQMIHKMSFDEPG